jgi:hypothetical protein
MIRSEPGSPGPEPAAGPPDGPRRLTYDEKVIRAFIRDDRLVSIPAQERKRLVVLRYLRDRCFTEDRTYPEAEVNQRLALYHPDVATLRRGMVDAGFVTRASGAYRRA